MVTGTASRPRLPTAKWGAACGTCAAAKAKCLRSNDTLGSKCDRCERLLKDCTDQVHRPRKKRTVKPSKTTQIEEKLNGLYSLLKASGSLNKANLSSETLSLTDDLASALSTQHSSGGSPASLTSAPTAKPWIIPSSFNSEAPATCICRPDVREAPPPPGTDDELLDIFRRELQNVCPFVIVPQDMTATALKAKRPFLMAAIRLVASYRSLRSMRAQMFQLMKYIGEHVLVRSEKSLDLLLGILVIVQWYPYHFCTHSQLGNLVGMASSLVVQLGLNRHPRPSERIGLRVLKMPEGNVRTHEERRAYVHAWYIASVCSTGFWKMENMPHTRYLDECLNDLLMNPEYETDTKLVHLVRIQCLAQRIGQINCTDPDLEDVNRYEATPRSFSIASLQADLDQVRNNLSPELLAEDMIQTHLNTATLKLYEPLIVDTAAISSLCAAFAANSASEDSPLNNLSRTRDALTRWFEHWLSIPASEFYRESTGGAAQLTYAIIMLGRWTKLATPHTLMKEHKLQSRSTDCSPGIEDHRECLSSLVGRKDEGMLAGPSVTRSAAKVPFSFGLVTSQLEADPQLPLELKTLRMHIEARPELIIDTAELMSSIITRFEQINATLQDISVEPGKVSPNVWMMGAIRVRITRANLERWAELVTEGMAKASINDDKDSSNGGGAGHGMFQSQRIEGLDAEPSLYGNAWTSLGFAEPMMAQDYYQTVDMMPVFDPSTMAMDGSWEWSTLLNSMNEYMEY